MPAVLTYYGQVYTADCCQQPRRHVKRPAGVPASSGQTSAFAVGLQRLQADLSDFRIDLSIDLKRINTNDRGSENQ